MEEHFVAGFVDELSKIAQDDEGISLRRHLRTGAGAGAGVGLGLGGAAAPSVYRLSRIGAFEGGPRGRAMSAARAIFNALVAGGLGMGLGAGTGAAVYGGRRMMGEKPAKKKKR